MNEERFEALQDDDDDDNYTLGKQRSSGALLSTGDVTHSPGMPASFRQFVRDEREKCMTEKLLDEYFPISDGSDRSMPLGPAFTRLVTAVVIVNCVEVGIRCQMGFTGNQPRDPFGLGFDVFITAVYILEMYWKWKLQGLQDYFMEPMNWIDFIVTTCAIVELIVDLAQVHGPHALSVMALLRLLRIFRIFRILTVLREIPSLAITIGGLAGSMNALVWVLFVLLLIIYTFAILFVYLVHDEDDEWFGDLWRSMLTMASVVVLNKWTDVLPKPTTLWYLLPFYSFVVLTSFGVGNILVGVIVDATAETREKLMWSRNREQVIRMGQVWEERLKAEGLGEYQLRDLDMAGQERKWQQRSDRIHEVLEEIIKANKTFFPPGMDVSEFWTMVDKDGNGVLDHREFSLSLGRLLLSGKGEEKMLSLLNQSVNRRYIRQNRDIIKENHDSQAKMLQGWKECLSAVEQSRDETKRSREETLRNRELIVALSERMGRVEDSLGALQEHLSRLAAQPASKPAAGRR